MDDLISRRALCDYALNQKDKSVTPNDIMRFPSAQPVDKDMNVPVNDCISRAAAIDAMCELMHHWFGCDTKDEIREIKRELEKLPSAQPETCAYWDGESNICALHRPSAQSYIDPCETCQYSSLDWDEEPCDSCTMGGETNHYKPSAQPQIIRCEDCMFYKADDVVFPDRQDWCEMWESGTVAYGYCYHAERKEYVEEA